MRGRIQDGTIHTVQYEDTVGDATATATDQEQRGTGDV
jgi:hypothetical protein